MDTIIDLLSAFVIAGFVMLGITNLNIYSSQIRFKSNSNLKLSLDAKTLSDIIENDFRKIGFGYSGISIITALSNEIKFIADVDSNGVIDTLSYFLSDSTEVLNTENPNDKILYRVINSDTSKGPSLGITDIKFSYKAIDGTTTTVLGNIKYITAEIWVESPVVVNEEQQSKYLFTYWELSINPRNI